MQIGGITPLKAAENHTVGSFGNIFVKCSKLFNTDFWNIKELPGKAGRLS